MSTIARSQVELQLRAPVGSLAERRELQKTLFTAMQNLAGYSDQPVAFVPADTAFGTKLAATPWVQWTPKMIRAARILGAKYHRQLGFNTLQIPDVTQDEIDEWERKALKQSELGFAGGRTPSSQTKDIPSSGIVEEKSGLLLVKFPRPPAPIVIERLKKECSAHWWKEKLAWKIYNNPLISSKIADCLSSLGIVGRPGLYEEMHGVTRHSTELAIASRAEDVADFNVEGLGLELYGFQKAGVKYALDAKRLIVADQMGLGKTCQALATVHAARAYPAVIVVPASVLWNWAREAHAWIPAAYISVLDGWRSTLNADIILTTYGQFQKWAGQMVEDPDVFQRDGKKKKMKFVPGILCDKPIRALICDEAHYLKNNKALRTQVVKGFSKHCATLEYTLLLTGTPVLNRPKELISQLEIIDRLKDLGGWSVFTKRYCGGHKEFGHWVAEGANNLPELNQKLRSLCYVRREKKDVLKELPPKQRVSVPMEITNRGEYDEAEADIARWCAEQAVKDEEFLFSIQRLPTEERKRLIALRKAEAWYKARQAEELRRIGVLRTLAARGKLTPMQEWVEDFLESDEKLIFFADHIEIQKSMLSEVSKNWKATHIFGEDEARVREGNVQQFQNDANTRIIVCSLMGAGVGWTGTAASNVAFGEFGWNPSVHDQAGDRAHRIGQTDSVTEWYLFGEKTIDQDSVELIEAKRAVVTAATTGEVAAPTESILHDLVKRLAEKGRALL